jgi:hypothetical protein
VTLQRQSVTLSVQVGLRKLLDAEGEVNVMKQELIALQPELIKTGGW